MSCIISPVSWLPLQVYQYNFFTNFPTTLLDKPNPEIPDDD
jgi:hypothetical protein